MPTDLGVASKGKPAADPWARMGWKSLVFLAVLIIIVSSWVAFERAVHSIGAFAKQINKAIWSVLP
jgi:hypothetical protein